MLIHCYIGIAVIAVLAMFAAWCYIDGENMFSGKDDWPRKK